MGRRVDAALRACGGAGFLAASLAALPACERNAAPRIDATSDQRSSPTPMRCEALSSVAIAGTHVRSAAVVAAGAFEEAKPVPPGFAVDYSQLPAFCRVVGSIHPSPDSDIRFELWLPASDWNGRFMQTGNGGAAGSLMYASLADPLRRGYAVAHTDTGHEGGPGDFAWAAGHPEKLIDYQYRAVHELTLTGKAITTAHYGRAPEKSYWNGCSTGGRQGLKEAQRFPDDYDAIVAGAPANHWSQLMALSILIEREQGPGGLRTDHLGLLKEGAIAACDAQDGVRDRVIADPDLCDFDPAALLCRNEQVDDCLSADEVAAAKRIYSGVGGPDGVTLYPGTGFGSEPVWALYASPHFGIGASYFRHVVARDASWEPTRFDVVTDLARAEAVDGGAARATDPDLSAFVARGGKLILYHGTTDGLIPYGGTIDYYERVVKTLGEGRTAKHVKLYVVPGMDHCYGGDGAYEIDWQTAMEDWMERGRAPGALRASHPAIVVDPTGTTAVRSGRPFARPVCPYPQAAVPKAGRRDESDAASFECREP
jgi:feruloyl esterase